MEGWAYPVTLTLIFGILSCTHQTEGGPEIVGDAQVASVPVGSSITFTCVVENLLANQVVSWWFIEHSVQITYGDMVVTSNHRYTVSVQREAGTALNTFNVESVLSISHVSGADEGHYKCEVTGTEVIQTHSLDVLGVSTPATTIDTSANFTDCCLSEGVSAGCLPLCYPSGVTAQTDSSNCAADLPALIKCGADGRNHAPCCRRRGIPDVCLRFCANDLPAQLSLAYSACLRLATSIISCYEEGQVLLPSAPRDLEVEVIGFNSARLLWEPPEENEVLVTGYRVHYQETDIHAYYQSTDILANTHYDLVGLNYGASYKVYVIAMGIHGSSLPSYIMLFHLYFSPPGVSTPGGSSTMLVQECCHDVDISRECIPSLCAHNSTQVHDPALWGCFSEYEKMYTCRALQANHTVCCRSQGLPTQCLGMCEGRPPSTLDHVVCLQPPIPSIVQACVDLGHVEIPGPPTLVHLIEVTSVEASIAWQPPTRGADRVRTYRVLYRKETQSEMNELLTPNQHVTLSDLDPSTRYTVELFSLGNNGSSLPSEQVMFLTYNTEDLAHAAMTTVAPGTQAPPHDIQACCRSSSIAAACQNLCSYDMNVQEIGPEHFGCLDEFQKILFCGAGGKNHSRCCADRGVAASCLGFCAIEEGASIRIGVEHVTCIAQSGAILACMEEGQAVIPTRPEGFRVHDLSPRHITLQWSRPSWVPTPLVAYLVQYRVTNMQVEWNTVNVNLATSYIMQNLLPDTEYDIQVMAASANGTSLPTPRITARTLPTAVEPPLLPGINVTAPANVTACCQLHRVSAYCMAACDGQGYRHIYNCSADLPQLLSCAADGRDHRACCEREHVPQMCEGFCRGEDMSINIASMECMRYMQEIMTCLHEGHELLPSQPLNFMISSVGTHQMTLLWDPPSSNSTGVMYSLFYKEESEAIFSQIQDIQSPFSISQLSPGHFYSLYLLAYTVHGASQPTNTFSIRTLARDVPVVRVTQDPPNFLHVGGNVTLTCAAHGEPPADLAWLRPDGEMTWNSTLCLRVGRRTGGKYTCVASNHEGNLTTKDIYLKVQYAPVIETPELTVYVPPDRGLSATLTCLIRGYPPLSNITWTKNHSPLDIQVHPRMSMSVRDLEARTQLEVSLTIMAVSELRGANDFGTYSCHAENRFGPEIADIVLAKLPEDGVTIEPIVPAPPVTNVTACCIEQNVQDACMPACTFDVDITVISNLNNPMECLPDLPKLTACAADGRNHSQCCINANLPTQCLPFCAGLTVSLTAAHLVCVAPHIETIINCMEMGHELIPSRPRNVQGHMLDDGHILVKWQEPRMNADAVEWYFVNYTLLDSLGSAHSAVVEGRVHQAILEGTHADAIYTIYVFSSNHYGLSQRSNMIHVITEPDLMPSSPRDLHVIHSDTYQLHLMWSPPETYPGAVLTYKVHYHLLNGGQDYKQVQTNSTDDQFILSGLEPGSYYEAFITAVGSSGESEPSEPLIMYTLAASHPSHSGPAIGISVTIVLLLLILLLAYFFSARLKRRWIRWRERPSNSVAFENPSYANTEEQIRGLPHHKEDQPDVGADLGYATMRSSSRGIDQFYDIMGSPMESPQETKADSSAHDMFDLGTSGQSRT